MTHYKLDLTEEQAAVLAVACEFYARVRMGQFNEIIWRTLDVRIDTAGFCERRDEAERLLLEARKQLYPDLHGIGHSYGIGKFEDADRAFDIYQVIRHARGGERVPFSYYDLPKIEKVEVE